jgi:hypothetical protein
MIWEMAGENCADVVGESFEDCFVRRDGGIKRERSADIKIEIGANVIGVSGANLGVSRTNLAVKSGSCIFTQVESVGDLVTKYGANGR